MQREHIIRLTSGLVQTIAATVVAQYTASVEGVLDIYSKPGLQRVISTYTPKYYCELAAHVSSVETYRQVDHIGCFLQLYRRSFKSYFHQINSLRLSILEIRDCWLYLSNIFIRQLTLRDSNRYCILITPSFQTITLEGSNRYRGVFIIRRLLRTQARTSL